MCIIATIMDVIPIAIDAIAMTKDMIEVREPGFFVPVLAISSVIILEVPLYRS